MARLALLSLALMAACLPVDSASPAWPPLTPRAPTAVEALDAPAPPEAAPAPTPAAPTEAEAPPAEAPPADPAASTEGELSDAELLAAAMGIELPPEPTPAPPAPEAPPAALPGAPASGWGVRLVSTLPDTQPPRAVLALSSGEEIVVEPGSLVPAERVVVMAVGRDAIQIARVVPAGDHARIETETLVPLYAHRPPPAPSAP